MDGWGWFGISVTDFTAFLVLSISYTSGIEVTRGVFFLAVEADGKLRYGKGK